MMSENIDIERYTDIQTCILNFAKSSGLVKNDAIAPAEAELSLNRNI
jgi:hypothetical protein